MIDLMALFAAPGGEAKPGRAAAPGEGGGIFAALIAALASGGGTGEAALPKGTAGLIAKMTALVEGAERALASPDLSDAEIGDVLDRLVADLAGLIAAQPKLAARVTGVLELLADPAAGVAELPQRILAEALPALRAAVQADQGAADGQGAAVAPGLAPLLTRIVRTVAELAPGGTAPVASLMAGGGVAPVVAGPAQAQAGPLAAPAPDTLAAAPAPLANAAAPPAIAEATAPAPLPTPQAGDLPAPPAPAAAAPLAQAPGAGPAAMPAPAAPPLPVEPREVLGQLRAQVGEQGRIRVELRPDGLGAVEIDLAPDEAGQLRVVVRAENAAILGMLRGDREGLLALLRDAGHDVEDGAMSFGDLGPGREGGRDADRDGPARPGWSPVLGAADPDAADPAPRGPGAAPGGVDMRV